MRITDCITGVGLSLFATFTVRRGLQIASLFGQVPPKAIAYWKKKHHERPRVWVTISFSGVLHRSPGIFKAVWIRSSNRNHKFSRCAAAAISCVAYWPHGRASALSRQRAVKHPSPRVVRSLAGWQESCQSVQMGGVVSAWRCATQSHHVTSTASGVYSPYISNVQWWPDTHVSITWCVNLYM